MIRQSWLTLLKGFYEKKYMISIIDFDYTLFDTLRFRQVALPKFFGLTTSEFNEYYQEIRLHDRGFYSVMTQIAEMPFETEKKIEIIKSLPKFLQDCKVDYLFPGAIDLLEQLKSGDNKLVLLTRGNTEWQKMKVNNLLLGDQKFVDFFAEVIYTEVLKCEHEDVVKYVGQKVVIINDNARENRDLLALFGDGVTAYLVQSEHSDNIKHQYKIWPDLESIRQDIIKK